VDFVVMLKRTASVHEGARRWARLAPRLETGNEVCLLNLDWEETGIRAFLRQKVLPLCTTLTEL